MPLPNKQLEYEAKAIDCMAQASYSDPNGAKYWNAQALVWATLSQARAINPQYTLEESK